MSRLFPHKATINRPTAVGTNGAKQQTEFATGAVCRFIPMASRTEIENGFSVGVGYDVYFQGKTRDIKAGDQLVWEGMKFNVRAVRTYDAGRVSHKHALVTREGQ